MSLDLILALIGFAFVTSITPGPNNMMLLASGVNFGFRRTIPHMLGIGIGFTLMVALIGFGLGEVFSRVPVIYTALKYIGAGYMLYLAWKIAHAAPLTEHGGGQGQPMTFLQAAAFQWVNPKAWVMAVSAISTYTQPDNYIASVFLISFIFGAVNLPSVSSWAAFGVAMRRLLTNPRAVRVFNITMALLLVASLWPIVDDLRSL
jgi:threonine/homoserine/homoserine lactone efflux protein